MKNATFMAVSGVVGFIVASFLSGPPGMESWLKFVGTIAAIGGGALGILVHKASGGQKALFVVAAVAALKVVGLRPRSGAGDPIEEPEVIPWVPAASVYFDDPDGHSLEFICMLDETPRPELGQVSWSEWRRA